jgi:hypothetical protein
MTHHALDRRPHAKNKNGRAISRPFVVSCKLIQPLAEWLVARLWRRNNLLAEGFKRGGACLRAHDRSSFPAARPEPPTGVLASGTCGTEIAVCLRTFSAAHALQILSAAIDAPPAFASARFGSRSAARCIELGSLDQRLDEVHSSSGWARKGVASLSPWRQLGLRPLPLFYCASSRRSCSEM